VATIGIATMSFGCGTDDSPKSSGNLMAADCGNNCGEQLDSGTRDTGVLDTGTVDASDADAAVDATDAD
jgi:hypothetical protein